MNEKPHTRNFDSIVYDKVRCRFCEIKLMLLQCCQFELLMANVVFNPFVMDSYLG